MWSRWLGICSSRAACSRCWLGIGAVVPGGVVRRPVSFGAGPALDAGGRGRLGDRVADVARAFGSGGGRGGHVRSAVEGGVWGTRSTRGGFDPTTLTYWRRRLAASERPQRIFEVVRQVISRDRGGGGQAAAGVGLHRPRRRGRPSGHRDPADRRGPSGGPRGPGRQGGDRTECTRLEATGQDYTATGQAADRLGRPCRPRSSWCPRWSVTHWRCWRRWTSRRSKRRVAKPAEAVALLALGRRARTSNLPRTLMAPTVGGGSPGRRRRTG